MQDIHHVLKKYWGYEKFRPGQEEIIRSVMSGHDTLALLPTGGGKSVCFQVPALAKEGLCLVISPLIALMKDQVYQLHRKGIKAAAVYSGLPPRMIDTLLDNCVYGDYKFLYISPERLATDEFRMRMEKMKISLLAVDEAHCIAQWGYDFRPPYLRIAEVREKLKNVPVLALTATATPDITDEIQERLMFRKKHVIIKSFVRPNLSFVVRETGDNKNDSVLHVLERVKGTAIVYLRSRKGTKELSQYLNRHGIVSDFYHAGLNAAERAAKQEAWTNNKVRVICCTNAFGMGIDKPDVRVVIHPDFPDTIEAYFQEAGRAGRDEKRSYAVAFYSSKDIADAEMKLKFGYPTVDFIKEVYESLVIYCKLAYDSGMYDSFDFDIVEFTTQYNYSAPIVMTVLKLLEQQGYIYVADSIYNSSMIRCIADKEVLNRFQIENKKLEPMVKFVLRHSPGVFEDFVSIHEEAVASRMKIGGDEVARQLTALHRFGIFDYQPRKNKPQIVFLQPRVRKQDLRLDINFIKKRKAIHDEKLRQTINYLTEKSCCRMNLLVGYFGEKSDDCGICDVCLEKKRTNDKPLSYSEIASAIEAELKQSSLTLSRLHQNLNIDPVKMQPALDYLIDRSKIRKNEKGEIVWVEE